MSLVVEIADGFRSFVENRASAGQFSSVAEYIHSLIERERRLEILIAEAEADIERGDYVVHQPGDVSKRVRELIEQRRGDAPSCSK